MIIRTDKKSNYTILPNEFLLDETISDKARGLLARLLSRPDNWNLNINHLVKTGKGGHTTVRSTIKELEAAGYIQKDVSRHANGRIVGVEYIIHESPVKSCGDRPVPVQSSYGDITTTGKAAETKPQEVQAELFDETILPDTKLGPQVKEDRSLVDPDPEPHIQEPHTQVVSVENNRMRKTVIKETAPIINTDIKQTLRVITAAPVRDEKDQVSKVAKEEKQQQLTPTVSEINSLLNLIPEQFASPMTTRMINKSLLNPSISVGDIADAIVYSSERVCGGRLQFKSYLDKMIQNGEAVGYQAHRDEQTFIGGFSAGPSSQFSNVFPNGSPTGSQRMDRNLAACLEFAAYCENRKEATA